MDLVIRGGQIVTADTVVTADLGISAGVIAQIGGTIEAGRELDARGKLVLPGGVDAHVHLSSPPDDTSEPRWVDDFATGSAAALAGGITTLGNMTFPADGELPFAALRREAAEAARQTITDLFLHPVLATITPPILDEVPRLREHGCGSIKFFTAFAWFDAQVEGYLEATRRAGAAGLMTLIHCEDHALLNLATSALIAAGNTGLRFFGASRPVVAEVVATQRAVAFAEATGAPVYLVHVSSARALAVCAEAQSRGIPVYVETRPLYLHLTEDRYAEADGAKYVAQPPLRTPDDVDALWAGLAAGTVHTVCSDHAPWSLAAKLDPAHSLTNLRPGVENLQTLMPMLYSEGVRTGRLTLRRFVELTSTNAARLFGLYPRKGAIALGADADVVIFDPELTRTVHPSMLKSRADYSPFEGWQVTGWPVTTLRRGEVVFQNDTVLGQPGSGRLVECGAAQLI